MNKLADILLKIESGVQQNWGEERGIYLKWIVCIIVIYAYNYLIINEKSLTMIRKALYSICGPDRAWTYDLQIMSLLL